MKRSVNPRFISDLSRLACLLMLVTIASVSVQADVLRIGLETQNGTLEGYDGRSFQFRDAESGKVKDVPRTNVKDLKLDKPRKATVAIMGKSEPSTMLMAGYARGQFLLLDNGKKTAITGMRIENIKLETPSRFGASTAPTPTPAKQIPTAAINELLARPNLTAEQKETLEQYKAIKAKYNAFLAESSAMVSAMDSMTGNDRMEALNNLRLRKDSEQPLKHEMAVSQEKLLSTFPELKSGAPTGMQPLGGQDMTAMETITLSLPKLGENEILIVDTGVFRQLGQLTTQQKQAIMYYEAAAADYEKLTTGTPTEAELMAVQERLTVTQANLFSAFPNVRVVRDAY